MGANGFHVATYEIPDPTLDPNAGSKIQRLNSSLAFDYPYTTSIRTLSSSSVSSGGGDRVGFLYVPDLPLADACTNASSAYIPANTTRKSDLPSNAQLIAIAPWLSPSCTLSYLHAANYDPLVAFIFFLPNGNSDMPPAANDAVWTLGDGGQWKSDFNNPVYAIPAVSGRDIIYQLALYSGNLTSVPNANDLIQSYPSTAYVRLSMDVALSGNGVPSIWIFLLIIVAILIAVVAIISASMHLVQRRRRNALRTRIVNGEVDLEALGIRRITVPQDEIDAMPVYAYSMSSKHQATADADQSGCSPPTTLVPGQDISPKSEGLYQPNCAICLDDYVESESRIRELPCKHIFHPECIDTFLKENSSLCPLCKTSVLPKGYCPSAITIGMVRRERRLRRQRNRRATSAASSSSTPGIRPAPPTPIEMATENEASNLPPPASVPGQREWARRRALAMLGSRATAEDSEVDQGRQSRSAARKIFRTIFPGGTG